MTQDVRGIANFVLDTAQQEHRLVSNLAINKIIYFLHAAFLHEFGEPLVSAKIEAWKHGPVFREIYHQFKSFGKGAIEGRAKKLNIATASYADVDYVLSENERDFLQRHCVELLKVPASKLVDMSHVEDSPWHYARHGNGRVNPGIEITNDLILAQGERLSRH